MSSRVKALALYSGGLDSTLALVAARRAGAEVLPVKFTFPFSRWARRSRAETRDAQQMRFLGLPLRHEDVGEAFVEIVRRPAYGYGKHLNPCIDCRLLMLRKAKDLMAETGAAFLITGEVVGQRPMSQHRQTLTRIDRAAGLEGWIVRPLSAKVLPPTQPEAQGWIDRERLFDLTGRSRVRQLELAREWGLTDIETPAGGCLLTDEGYARRARDLLESGLLSVETARIIQFGRYLNLDPGAKLVVARHESECRELEHAARPADLLLRPGGDRSGPTALLLGPRAEEFLETAARVVAAFIRHGEEPVSMQVERVGQNGPRRLRVPRAGEAEVSSRLLR